jgi:phage replication-related protein YjqB (UPF0714/DUF867 family)
MSEHHVQVRPAPSTSDDLKNSREHCWVAADVLRAVGIDVGQQVRIKRNDDDYAVYTVTNAPNEDGDNVVRMGLSGRRRLGTSEQFEAELDSQVVHPTMSIDEAEAIGEFVERLHDDGHHTGLIAIAPHGGDIEVRTERQARRVASELADMAVSSWLCKGFHPGSAEKAWHITSVDIHPTSFPLLHSVFTRGFGAAVAFHGFAQEEILVGGRASAALKTKIKSAIETAVAGAGIPVRIAKPTDEFGGDDRHNIVNRLTVDERNGIQIEQSLTARTGHWREIADAVASVYRALG